MAFPSAYLNCRESVYRLLLSFFGLLQPLQSHHQSLVEGLLHSVVGAHSIDGLPPSVLLVGSQRELVLFLDLGLLLHIEMPIAFGFGVVVVLILLELV